MPNSQKPIDKETIDKLQNIIDVYERDKFDDEELIILHKMIELWKAFEVLGKVAHIGRNVAIWLAAFIVLWMTPIDQLLKAFKKWIGLE